MKNLPVSDTARRWGAWTMWFKTMSLAGILSSCSTATTINKEGDKVSSGYGNRTVVTFYTDGRKEVRVEPIRFMEAVLSGGVSGFVQGILNSRTANETK